MEKINFKSCQFKRKPSVFYCRETDFREIKRLNNNNYKLD